MSRLLWFLIGSAATLVTGAVITHLSEDGVDRPGEGSPSAPENNEEVAEENPAEAG